MKNKKNNDFVTGEYITTRELALLVWKEKVQELTKGKNIDQLNEEENEKLEKFIKKKRTHLHCLHSQQKGCENRPGYKLKAPKRTRIGPASYLYKIQDVNHWIKQQNPGHEN